MPTRSSHPIYNPEHWRNRAEEMRVMAEDMHDQQAKTTMLRIADEYELLAQRAALRSAGKLRRCPRLAVSDQQNDRIPPWLISNAHSGPVGTTRLTVGKQGSIKPGRCRDIPQLNHPVRATTS